MPASRGRQKILSAYPESSPAKVVSFGFRASQAEALALTTAARARGLSPGEFCRVASLGLPIPTSVLAPLPAVDHEAVLELKRIGVNLNQAVAAIHLANRKGDIVSPLTVQEIADCASLVRRTVFRLIGRSGLDAESSRDRDIVSTSVSMATHDASGEEGLPPESLPDAQPDDAQPDDAPPTQPNASPPSGSPKIRIWTKP